MILLARHGETPSNAARVVQTPETPLSPLGVRQAEQLAARLASLSVARILSSDLSRALQTAERVKALTGVELALDPLLQERNFGDVRGTPYSELGFDLFSPDFDPPGGESWEEFHKRVDSAWARMRDVAAATPGNLAVVTHGLVCYSLALRHLQLPFGVQLDLRVPNTALALIDPAPPFRVSLWASTEHLDASADEGASA
jgi:2,3-bisphosphoglycerate-dependent phosphoglycerate mutase